MITTIILGPILESCNCEVLTNITMLRPGDRSALPVSSLLLHCKFGARLAFVFDKLDLGRYIFIGDNRSCEDHEVVSSKALRLPITKGYKDCCT